MNHEVQLPWGHPWHVLGGGLPLPVLGVYTATVDFRQSQSALSLFSATHSPVALLLFETRSSVTLFAHLSCPPNSFFFASTLDPAHLANLVPPHLFQHNHQDGRVKVRAIHTTPAKHKS